MTDASFVNIAAHLPAMAQRQTHATAISVPCWELGAYRSSRKVKPHYSYRMLNQECDRWAHGLQSIGIRRGVRTVLMTPPSLQFFALTFALFKIGAIPVIIDPGMGVRNLG